MGTEPARSSCRSITTRESRSPQPRLSASVIEQPAIIRQILDHLGLPTGAASLRAPPDQTNGLVGDQARDWSYEPLG